MSKGDNLIEFTATATGFYGSGRQREGSTFMAPDTASFSWAEPTDPEEHKGKKKSRKAAPAKPDVVVDPYLDRNAADIVADLKAEAGHGKTKAELTALLDNEQSTKDRATVTAAIGDAIANADLLS